MIAINRKPLDESTIGQAEEDAAEQVRKMVQALENAIDIWEKSGHKPPELSENFERYRALLLKLKDWNASKAAGTFEVRLARLRTLAELRKVI